MSLHQSFYTDVRKHGTSVSQICIYLACRRILFCSLIYKLKSRCHRDHRFFNLRSEYHLQQKQTYMSLRQCRYGSKLRQVRYASIQSSATQSHSPAFKIDLPKLSGHGPFADKPVFEVIGSPFSLLNARIPSKAILYTRRGTLIGINGDVKNLRSTLSVFNSGFFGATSRILGGMPFLYQKVQSDDHFTALIGTRSTATSFAVLELDGLFDWNITSKDALLAWSGPQASTKQQGIDRSLLHISMNLTGRGSAVIAGNGQIYQVVLQQEDEYIIHPSSVLAYAVSCPPPQPLKLQSIRIALPYKLPSFRRFLLRYEFFQVMSKQAFWITFKNALTSIKSFFSKMIWGDQLFVRFKGPTTILLQSRSRTQYQYELEPKEPEAIIDQTEYTPPKTFSGSLKVAVVKDGQVELTDTKSFTN